MRTKQTGTNYTVSNVHKVRYADATSLTLPMLPELYDSVNVVAHFVGTGASVAMSIGSTVIHSDVITNVESSVWNVKVTNTGSGNFVVITSSMENGAYAATSVRVTTEDMATLEQTLSFTNVSGSSHYITAGT